MLKLQADEKAVGHLTDICIMEVNWLLIAVGVFAGFLSSAFGFGGGMVLLPVITSVYGIELAIPISTIAQLLSNLSRAGLGFRQIQWRKVLLFLATAAPLTALGAIGFSLADKTLMTRILCIGLIIFAIIKVTGKIRLKGSRTMVLTGGAVTGFVNGMLGISGPLGSAVFLALDLTPIAYIASEAAAATAMHIVKIVVYNKFALLDLAAMLNGLYIGVAMMIGNYAAMKLIGKMKNKIYQRIVALAMIALSVWLFITA